jgi:hypothetical protein
MPRYLGTGRELRKNRSRRQCESNHAVATLNPFFGLLLSISLAISILRYRLWDIEVIANRTLFYGVMTGVLVLVEFAAVARDEVELD